jgi:hypothetical protein
MQGFAGVFFEMGAGDADAFADAIDFNIQVAVADNRQLKLADLIA